MKLSKNEVLVLRTCNSDMTSYNKFLWPRSGFVEAPDWKATKECGNGLHGFLWGEGSGALANWDDEAKWLVVKVNKKNLVELDGKVKFKEGKVVYSGSRKKATKLIFKHHSQAVIIGAVLEGKNIHVGYKGTATAGNFGVAIAEDNGKAIAGDYGTATVGVRGKAIAGDNGEAIAGNYGKVSVGYRGKATVGDYGKVIAGDGGEAIAGSYGEATAGNYGKVTVGKYGKASVGDEGIIEIEYYYNRVRKKIGYIGENGLKPNTLYQLNDKNEFEEVK